MDLGENSSISLGAAKRRLKHLRHHNNSSKADQNRERSTMDIPANPLKSTLLAAKVCLLQLYTKKFGIHGGTQNLQSFQRPFGAQNNGNNTEKTLLWVVR